MVTHVTFVLTVMAKCVGHGEMLHRPDEVWLGGPVVGGGLDELSDPVRVHSRSSVTLTPTCVCARVLAERLAGSLSWLEGAEHSSSIYRPNPRFCSGCVFKQKTFVPYSNRLDALGEACLSQSELWDVSSCLPDGFQSNSSNGRKLEAQKWRREQPAGKETQLFCLRAPNVGNGKRPPSFSCCHSHAEDSGTEKEAAAPPPNIQTHTVLVLQAVGLITSKYEWWENGQRM